MSDRGLSPSGSARMQILFANYVVKYIPSTFVPPSRLNIEYMKVICTDQADF